MIDFGERIKPSSGRAEGPSFGEIVGQTELKRALLAVAANDDLDGLLVRGEKGTAKSTTVRALRGLLPPQRAVADCPYGCPPDDSASQCADCRERTDPPTTERPVPLVTLPLGATRERVVGSLSTADALDGEFAFEPGLLARANRGILYVDEVNLLDDHLVDVLLDAAASGWNRVERDGVSERHPADVTLVGTMNPEEGDLRPQLRDRFALQATVTGCEEIDDRVAIIDQALGDVSAGSEPDQQSPADDDYAAQLRAAAERLPEVDLPRSFAAETAELCRDAGVEGHRGDIATARAARTFAALDGRTTVLEPDVREAAALALPHRLQSRPFEDAPDADDLLDEHFERDGDEGDESSDTGSDSSGDDSGDPDETDDTAQDSDETGRSEGPPNRDAPDPDGDDSDAPDGAGEDADAGGSDERGADGDPCGEGSERSDEVTGPTAARSAGQHAQNGAGADSSEDGNDSDGVSTAPGADDPDDADEATPLLPGQAPAGADPTAAVGAPDIAPDDASSESAGREAGSDGVRSQARATAGGDGARVRTERAETGDAVDAAASVRAAAARGASSVASRDLRRSVTAGEASALVVFVVDASASMRTAMRAAKGTVLELLRDAYQHRDEVAVVAFAGDDADVLLPPTDSVTRAARHLKELPTGDRTPLPTALTTAADVLARADPAASVVVLVTDGRANVGDSPVADTRAAARRLAALDPAPHVVTVDADQSVDGLTDLVAETTDGVRVPLAELTAERVDAAAGTARET